jgi:phenylpropionate dioxygenase-like ring-hydroxylating dioxygenase large terminal subunit
MLNREDNELITRVGRGTPMGTLMRRYWMPALLSWELPAPDCEPVRVRLLGENLLAFRDTSGRVGIVDESCPHRLASLWFGRNEENGLRCVYHGWKFDVDGNCLEQMNEPVPFTDKVKLTAYPTYEGGGMIWTYLGDPALRPPEPSFEWMRAPESHRHVSKVIQESNWLQGLEGGIDSSHAPILHRKLNPASAHPGIPMSSAFVRGKAPTLEVDPTDYGYRYFGVRDMGDGNTYVRGYHFVMPFTQIRPQQFQAGAGTPDAYLPQIHGHYWVPMDDDTTMVWNWGYSFGDEPLSEEDKLERGNGNGADHVDQRTFRSFSHPRNNFRIDRAVQKTDTFTGIAGINTQDRAMQETMGSIVDRTREHLGPADRAVIVARQILLSAVRTAEAGGDPPGVTDSYYTIRAIEQIVPDSQEWREVLLPQMYPASERELASIA